MPNTPTQKAALAERLEKRAVERVGFLQADLERRCREAYVLNNGKEQQFTGECRGELQAWREVLALLRASDSGEGPEAADSSTTYAMPKDGWVCFHCGERFTTYGSARDHFGKHEGAEAGCLIDRVALENGGTPERGRGLLMALRKAEAEIASLRAENERLGNDARLWHESEADRVRRIGHVQWWQELDSKQGEILALQERLAAKAASPARAALIAELRERETDLRALLASGIRKIQIHTLSEIIEREANLIARAIDALAAAPAEERAAASPPARIH